MRTPVLVCLLAFIIHLCKRDYDTRWYVYELTLRPLHGMLVTESSGTNSDSCFKRCIHYVGHIRNGGEAGIVTCALDIYLI